MVAKNMMMYRTAMNALRPFDWYVKKMVAQASNIKPSITIKDNINRIYEFIRNIEKRVVSRPYGVSMLVAGIDKDGSPKLFKNDPSGKYVRFKAWCIGQGGENGLTTMQAGYRENMSLDESA